MKRNLEPSRSPARRGFLEQTGGIAARSVLAAGVLPGAFAADSHTIHVALVGCGGRGTGAAVNALSVENGPIRLVAMADVFPERLARSYEALTNDEAIAYSDRVDVPEDRRFLGFDAYRKAIDLLSPGDVVILATPPAFRWPHFDYAIEKGINVFMEKPVTVDGPTTRRILQLAERSEAKKLKVGVGLMCRHCDARAELYRRIRDGQMGDIHTLRAYRMGGLIGWESSGPKPAGISELLYQVQRFHSFLWASGGAFTEFFVHNIDECCWMKDAWPVSAIGTGGCHARGDAIDQNFDDYSAEFTFADGAVLYLYGQTIDGCHRKFSSFAHGTKGSAVISISAHTPARCRISRTQNPTEQDAMVWAFPEPEPNPYQLEWDRLVHAIRRDTPFNEVKRGAMASLVTSMGRMAAHTGQVVTLEQMLNHEHEFAPDVDKLTMDSPAPLQAGPDGKYPLPRPGITTEREY